jgi:hypothetical protein
LILASPERDSFTLIREGGGSKIELRVFGACSSSIHKGEGRHWRQSLIPKYPFPRLSIGGNARAGFFHMVTDYAGYQLARSKEHDLLCGSLPN